MNKIAETNNIRLARPLLSLLLCLWLALPAWASEALDKFLASSATDPESVSVLVMDLATGKVMESHNAEKPLIPASIMKAVTIAELLETTGIDYKYRTPVYITGPVVDGSVQGNLLIVGSGDPSVNSPKLTNGNSDLIKEIVNALTKKKITNIKGYVKIDGSIFAEPAQHPNWGSDDKKSYYGTGIHGFNFEGNASGKSAVTDPAARFRTKLLVALTNAGITVSNEEVRDNKRSPLLTHTSPTIDEIMRSCMMRSDNMFAESLLRTFSVLKGGDGSFDDGTRQAADFWRKKGLKMNDIKLSDGSGLSRANRLTADFMAQMLAKMAKDPYYVSFFPLAGQEGTLASFLKDSPLDGYIAMKTGSMSGIQCYAGYKLDDDYAPTHVVVVMVNNMKGNRALLKQAVSDMLLGVFSDSPHLNGQSK